MEDNLEIYFCEICSESIPAQDLRSRAALEVNGKVIGPCCLPLVQRQPARAGSSSMGLTAMGAILLAAVAGATIHLEWRFSDHVAALQERIAEVETGVISGGSKQIAEFEKALDGAVQSGELKPLAERLGQLESKLGASETRLDAKFGGVRTQLAGLEEKQQQIITGQNEIRGDVKDIETGILRLERDVADAMAAPRGHAVADRPREADPKPPAAVKDADAADPAPALPPALAQQVARLRDADPGDRFEAVDQLILSKAPAALPHLVPMLKDSDAFVRRLTAEGLAGFKAKESVEALIVALADPESIVRHTAFTSLKKLTGQTIAFDPDGSPSARSQGQRRFKDWWDKAKATY